MAITAERGTVRMRAITRGEVAPWEQARNAKQVRVHWTFTVAAARQKLKKLYPSIED